MEKLYYKVQIDFTYLTNILRFSTGKFVNKLNNNDIKTHPYIDRLYAFYNRSKNLDRFIRDPTARYT